MKVLFPFYKKTFGGSDCAALELIDILKSEGYVVLSVLQQENALLEAALDARGVKYSVMNNSWAFRRSLKDIFLAPIFVLQLIYFLVVNRVSVVHTNDGQTHLNWAVPCRIARVKHVWHQRTFLQVNGWRKWLIKSCCRFLYISDYVVSDARSVICEVSSCLLPDVVVHSPLEIRQRSGEKYKIAFFGGLRREKNPILFLDVARLLKSSLYADFFEFSIYGGGQGAALEEFYHQVEVRGLTDCLKFNGYTPLPMECMQDCDFLLSLCLEEAYGRVAVEGALAGAIVVAADAAGYPEVVSDGVSGFLISPPTLAAAYVDRILEVVRLGRQWQYEYRISAQAYVLNKYSFPVYRKEIVRLYSELLPLY